MKPGLYALTNAPLTVSQAIASAGGEIRSLPTSGSGTLTDLTSLPLADLSHVTLISQGKREVLDLRKFYLFGDQTQDRLVHAGDIIQVPNNTNDQVHVIGEVLKQGNYPMSNGSLNLAQALGEAGRLRPHHLRPGPRLRLPRRAGQAPRLLARRPLGRRHAPRHAVRTPGRRTWSTWPPPGSPPGIA